MKTALHNNAKLYAQLVTDDALDDAELTPIQFRVYVHIWHVCSKETVQMPPITKIADKVRMNRETVIKAIRELEFRGFLRVDRAWGEQAHYYINPKHCWIPVPKTDQYLKPTGTQNRLVPKTNPTSRNEVLVPDPPYPSSSPVSGSPSPLESSSSPPLTPPSSNPPVAKKTVSCNLKLTSEPEKKDKRRTACFEELQRHVVRNLGLTEDDACWLWEKWEGNGWKVDGKPMACWRSTASAWERGKYYPSQKHSRFEVKKSTSTIR